MEENRLNYLKSQANRLRRQIVNMCYGVGPERKAHPGPALSIADVVAALYFDKMNIIPDQPAARQRDRLILSKGHACTVLYSALQMKGILTSEDLKGFRHIDGMLQGHPDMKGTPGVDMTAGSLGNGLSAGVGMALAAKIDQLEYRVYVILGDGECQEGLVWEAAMLAPKYHLDNLIAIVDQNGLQSCDSVENTMPMEPWKERWESFGWNVISIDGHNMEQICEALDKVANAKGKPTVILAHTIKGKGVSFMENNNAWHQKTLTQEEYQIALEELGG
mgnify:CR=1 FL=1